ncbi:hypothetical protein JCM16161A_14570 [Vulcanisaeta sp. JCM 16161]|uniref:nucleotidyltransferase domain-containing protein n=1 Tax=Vulcanisaeta sp. JCM 16161 TaxID=1295372 RepID=UPI000AE81FED|nr:nucleotidyltransferase domain-containing protein [Vulcanisaeta sp. JCM 16161]
MGEEIINELRKYVRCLVEHGYRINSAVLFGSRARGDWLINSDVDLLIIIPGSEKSFLDRVRDFMACWDLGLALEVFPYTLDEVKRLMNRGSISLYDALDYGIVIYDDGTFEKLREIFKRAINEGIIRRVNGWWTIPEKPLME